MLLLRAAIEANGENCPSGRRNRDRSFKNDRAARTARLPHPLADLGDADPPCAAKSASKVLTPVIPNARVTLLAGSPPCATRRYRAFNDVALRDAIAKAIVIGPPNVRWPAPTITFSEGAGAMTGLAPDIQLTLGPSLGEPTVPGSSARVRQLAHRGADHIKIPSTGAVLPMEAIEIDRVHARRAAGRRDEARNFGLRVEAHAHARMQSKRIRAGVASIEHATLIDDEVLPRQGAGTYLDMDIYDEECIQDAPRKADACGFLEHDRDLGDIQRRTSRKPFAPAVKMSFGN